MNVTEAFQCLTLCSVGLTCDDHSGFCSASIYLQGDGTWDLIVHAWVFVGGESESTDLGSQSSRESRREAAKAAARAVREIVGFHRESRLVAA